MNSHSHASCLELPTLGPDQQRRVRMLRPPGITVRGEPGVDRGCAKRARTPGILLTAQREEPGGGCRSMRRLSVVAIGGYCISNRDPVNCSIPRPMRSVTNSINCEYHGT